MSRTDNLREGQITFEKVKTLITALEIIAEALGITVPELLIPRDFNDATISR